MHMNSPLGRTRLLSAPSPIVACIMSFVHLLTTTRRIKTEPLCLESPAHFINDIHFVNVAGAAATIAFLLRCKLSVRWPAWWPYSRGDCALIRESEHRTRIVRPVFLLSEAFYFKRHPPQVPLLRPTVHFTPHFGRL